MQADSTGPHAAASDSVIIDGPEADDYDNPWKDAIEKYLSSFLHFFFPAAHAEIDWAHPPTFLDQELRILARDAGSGKRIVDKLARVKRIDGEPAWVYIHLEVQGQQQEHFSKRMFVYHYRLFDRYQQPIASLALLTDDQPRWRPDRFVYRALGCGLSLTYPVAKLTDWAGSEDKLADSRNPFALLTRAHLATRATRHDPKARKAAKWQLLKYLYEHAWAPQEVIDFYQVLDWMMRLPKELEQQLRQDVSALEGELTMRYVTSFERLAMEEGMEKGLEKGLEQGLEQGLEKGIQEGIQVGQSRLLMRILTRRFGELPPWAITRLRQASAEELDNWLDRTLDAASLQAALDNTHAQH